jgi:DNA-binding transcriptional MerR regulator
MDTPILIGDEYLSQIKTCAALGYSVKRICTLLSLNKEQKLALSIRLTLPGDVYYEARRNGIATGEYNIDAELAKQAGQGDIDAITLLEERKRDRVEIDLRQQLFGA